jgi:hypothetical protein
MAVLSHQPDPLIPANRIVPEIPGGVAGVLQKALALNAGQRPATAADMREMLRDPDPYAETVLTPATATSVLPTEIHSAHTKIMPGATIHEDGRQTDIKTEVLPAYLSQVTDVKPLAKQTAAPRSRRLRFVASGLTAIVLACTAIGGAYLYNPALFHQDVEQAPAAQVPPVEDVVEPSTNSNLSNIATAELAPSSNTSETGSATVESVTSPDKSRESVKTNKPSTSKESPPPSIGGVIVQDGTVYAGNTKISNGRVETPNGVIDPNFNPRPGTHPPPMPPPDLRNLTPEQRRRVIRALRRNGVIVPKPSPQ